VSHDVTLTSGFTVREFARRNRVGTDRVRGWIRSGTVRAINTNETSCGRPRFIIPPEAVIEFERALQVQTPAPKTTTRRRRKSNEVDYYPD
jgi:hypothetical protein